MVELKPCPFCGGEAEIKKRTPGRFTSGYFSAVHYCCDIKSMSIVVVADTEEEAAERWNRRANDAPHE